MKALDLIRALEATGMTPYRISKESGVSQPTIHRIAEGQPDVMGSTLEKLEGLAKKKGIKVNGKKQQH